MEGSVLEGRYRIERLIGSGGMGEVWLAEDRRLGRWVAIKLLRDGSAGDVDREIEREARLTARLQHPNIVAIYDAGHAGDRAFLVMEYVHGVSLRDLLDIRGGRLPEEEAVRYGRQVADALAYAHGQGIFHSDIKPENILITEDGVAKAVDFGIAQTVNRTLSTSEARSILGTIAYLAPEVIQGEPPDARSDVYSLGLTIYELVAGRLPFSGVNPAAMAGQRLVRAPAPLRAHAPEASPALESILARALALVPADRFGGAAEFSSALRRAGEGAQASPRPAPVIVPRSPVPRRVVNPKRRAGGGLWLAVALTGLLAVTAGTAAALWAGSRDNGTDTIPTPTVEPTATPTPAETPTPEPTTTSTPTRTATPTSTGTATPTQTPARTPTPRPSVTQTGTPTATANPWEGTPTTVPVRTPTAGTRAITPTP